MAGFYAAVVLYSDAWRLIARAAGETPPWPGAPVEWTADQQLLWSLHLEYRAMIGAVATWDGELPEADVLENPTAFREWYDTWMETRRARNDGEGGGQEEHGWVLR